MAGLLVINNHTNVDHVGYFRAWELLAAELEVLLCVNQAVFDPQVHAHVICTMSANRPSVAYIFDVFRSAFFLTRYRWNNRAGSIFFDSGHFLNVPQLLMCKLLGFKKCWVVVHDVIPHEGGFNAITKFYNKLIFKLADGFILPSEFSSKQIEGRANEKYRAVRRLPLPIRPEKVQLPRSQGMSIFAFGRGQPYKGFHLLPEVLSRVKEEIPRASLLIAGVDVAECLPKVHLDNDIEVRDCFLAEEELTGLLLSHSCLIAPYLSATQSGVIMAGLAVGVPIVTTDVGANKEFLDPFVKAGMAFVVNPGDTTALAAAVVEALSAEFERHDMIGMAESLYSFDRYVRETRRLYFTICSRQDS